MTYSLTSEGLMRIEQHGNTYYLINGNTYYLINGNTKRALTKNRTKAISIANQLSIIIQLD